MNLRDAIGFKSVYRITGTPENFLTALRSKTWGFNDNQENNWRNLQPGSIIFFHSKKSDSYFIKNAPSCVIGFGVVGSNFFIDSSPLWIDEYNEGKSYPYRFKFSEIYLFSQIEINDDWDSTSSAKKDNTTAIIKKLVASGIPLRELSEESGDRFPHMGSYSGIKSSLIKDLLVSSIRQLTFYEGDLEINLHDKKSNDLIEVSTQEELHRYGKTLTYFDDVNEIMLREGKPTYTRNLKALRKADKAHFEILKSLRQQFEHRDFRVFSNIHVDLFAHNETDSYLVEAKSIENKNYKKQARKAIAQLLEYNYFELSDFKKKNRLRFTNEYLVLATSGIPTDSSYTKFINSINIKTLAVKNDKLIPFGDSIPLF